MLIRLTRPIPFRKVAWLAAACLWLPATGLVAGTTDETNATDDKSQPTTQSVLEDITPLNDIELESSYVGQASFKAKRYDGDGTQSQVPYTSVDEAEQSIELSRRFHLFDKIYFKGGVQYERYDFSSTSAPIPSSLQNLTGLFALEYVEKGEVGATITTSPGIFYSHINHITFGNVDVPTTVAFVVPLGKRFYLLLGAHYSALNKYPVLPVPGIIILITEKLRIEARPPNPRIIFSYSKALDFFAGAELLGESYKTDPNPDARPQDQRFSDAVVDYSETRLGAGITYSPNKFVDIDLNGGWDYARDFDYYRGQSTKSFDLHGAPYARISVSAEF